jgi:murein L,D-transpeptidase YafK
MSPVSSVFMDRVARMDNVRDCATTRFLLGVMATLLCVGIFYGHVDAVVVHGKTTTPHIPSCLIGLNLKEKPGYALVVEKVSQTLRVYEWDGDFHLKHTFPCSTGEASGKKEKTGDRKTPEGVFFFTKAFPKRDLSPTYGTGAFVLDYPNLIDRRQNRSGYNIWLHGTNKPLKKRDTNGCIALKNKHIDIVRRYIHLNRTPIIIKATLHMVSAQNLFAEQQALRDFLSGWRHAFTSGDKSQYLVYYDRLDSKGEQLWKTWEAIRPSWEKAQVPFEMKFENLALARSNPCVVALFDQIATLDKHMMRVGTVKLYLEPEKGSWKIIGEEYQPGTVSTEGRHPMAASLVRLETLRKDYKTVAELVAEWADAWSSKDIERYGTCYAEDFYAQRMSLKSWLKYKKRLNTQYKKINVVVEDLEVRQDGDRGTATFVQRYSSSRHQSVGIKRLRLKRVNGLWKIYRETWHKI